VVEVSKNGAQASPVLPEQRVVIAIRGRDVLPKLPRQGGRHRSGS